MIDGIVIVLGNDWSDLMVECNWLCDDSLLAFGCVVSTGGNVDVSVVSVISLYPWILLVTVSILSFGTVSIFSSHSVVVVIFGRHFRFLSIFFWIASPFLS